MMGLHFVAHYLFMPGLKVWTETVECPCKQKEETKASKESDGDLVLAAQLDKKEVVEPETCYCKIDEEKEEKEKAWDAKDDEALSLTF